MGYFCKYRFPVVDKLLYKRACPCSSAPHIWVSASELAMAEEEASSLSLAELLFSESRDYLLDPHGTQVRKADLERNGGVVGLFRGPHWLPKILDRAFSAIAQPHDELRAAAKPIAFVYVTADRDLEFIDTVKKYGHEEDLDIDRPDEESFADAVKKKLSQGWLYVPLDDVEARNRVAGVFKEGICHLSFWGWDAKLHTDQGLGLLDRWGARAYPFDKDRIDALEQELQQAKENQSLRGLLVHEDRDYLISSKSDVRVNVSELEGKTVAIYFSAHWCPPCQRFTPLLASAYSELKQNHPDFEVVFVSSDEDEESFQKYFEEMPWLAVPFTDLTTKKLLNDWFEVRGIPTLVILDGEGKTVSSDGMELVYKHGADAYPFTEERLEQLRQEEAAKREAETLESLLVTEERDYLLSRFEPVKIKSLVGKTVGLYFSAHWCPPCRGFTPVLTAVYDELKGRGEGFEIVFVSADEDQAAFDEYYGEMPWLALPFEDSLQQSLAQYFDISGIPALVIIGADGKTVTTDARDLISSYGADAFPFTQDRVAELEERAAQEAPSLPDEAGVDRVDENEKQVSGTVVDDTAEYVCEGDVCRKV